MKKRWDQEEMMAVLAVMAAAAREAEELLADDEEFDQVVQDEAHRRLRLFMKSARQMAR